MKLLLSLLKSKNFKNDLVIYFPNERQLNFRNKTQTLEPRVNSLLHCLYQSEGQIVSRESLIETVWQGRVVGDAAINRAVSELRKAFAYLCSNRSFIDTVASSGYRLQSNQISLGREFEDKGNHSARVSRHLLSYSVMALFLFTAIGIFSFSQSERSKPRSIWSINNIERLTNTQKVEYGVSASGKSWSYLSRSSENYGQVWLQPDDRLISDPQLHSYSAVLSPDASKIAYIALSDSNCNVLIVSGANSKNKPRLSTAKKIFECNPASNIRIGWTNDSQGILYRDRSDRSQPFHINYFDLASSSSKQITNPLNSNKLIGDYRFASLNKEHEVIFARYISSKKTRLLKTTDEHSPPKILTSLDFYVVWMQWDTANEILWLSDGNSFYYYEPKQNKLSKPLVTGHEIQSASLKDISESEVSILFSNLDSVTEIKVFELLNSESNELITPNNANYQVRPLRTRQYLSWFTKTNGGFSLVTHNISKMSKDLSPGVLKSRKIALPFSPNPFTRWEKAENDDLLFTIHNNSIYRIDLISGESSVIYQSDFSISSPTFCNETNSLIFSSNRTGEWQLWKIDLSDMQREQITYQGAYFGYTYDNKIFYTKFEKEGLYQTSVDSRKEESIVLDEISNTNWRDLQLVGDQLFFLKRDKGVWQYDIGNQTLKKVEMNDATSINFFDISSLGRLYYSRTIKQLGDVYTLTLEKQSL